MLWFINKLEHWSDNDIGIDDCELEDWLIGGEEVPGGFLCVLFCDAVL
jgi:hypothetical protein